MPESSHGSGVSGGEETMRIWGQSKLAISTPKRSSKWATPFVARYLRELSILLVATLTPVSLSAQGHGIDNVAPAPPGAGIAVPFDDPRVDPKKLELPELAGTRQALGSQLIDGRLPRPLIDYSAQVGAILQRITIFETGLVAIHFDSPGGRVQKRLILPADALEVYRNELSASRLERIRKEDLIDDSPDKRATVRVYDDEGMPVDRSFNSTSMLPYELEVFRTVLQDLFRALIQDRDVTNTVTGYKPSVGDRLVTDDQKTFEVVRIVENGKYVELACLSDPTRMFIASEDLHKHFIGSRRSD